MSILNADQLSERERRLYEQHRAEFINLSNRFNRKVPEGRTLEDMADEVALNEVRDGIERGAKAAKEQAERRARDAEEQASKLDDDRRRIHDGMRRGTFDGLTYLVDPLELLRVNGGRVQMLAEAIGLPREGFGALIGRQGDGKSKVAASFVAAAALGRPWCGIPINGGKPCNVLYLALENAVGVAVDLAACAGDRAEELRNRVRVTSSLPSLMPTPGSESGVSVDRWANDLDSKFGRKLGLVIVDTYTALLARNGADEVNGAPRFIDAFRGLIAVTGASVLFLGHLKKYGDEERGAALRDAADSMVPVTKEFVDASELRVRLALSSEKLAKRRHGVKPNEDLLLTFRDTQHGFALVEHAKVAPVAGSRKAGRQDATAKVLAVLEKPDAPEDLDRIAKTAGVGRSTCSTALAKLVLAEKVCSTTVGRKKSFRLVL